MSLRVLLAGFVLCVPVLAQAPAKRPMTFADLQAMKRVSDPQVSPSGKWVLFSVTDVVLEKNSKTNHLWIVPLDGKGPERQVTMGSGESNGRISPDGKLVMYSADDQIQVAAFDEAAGTVSAARAVTSLATGADGGVWAPDSKHFLFTSSVYPECESHAAVPQRFAEEAACNTAKDTLAAQSPVKAQVFDHLLYRHWNQYQGPKHSHIFYGEVGAAEVSAPEDITPASVIGDHEAPTSFPTGGPTGYAMAPDGREVAYVANLDEVGAESTNNDIFVLAVGAEPSRAMRVSSSHGSDDGPQYSPDGRWLAWRSQARNGYESDKFDLVVMDRATTTDKPGPIIQKLTSRFDGWVDEFAWGPKSDTIYFTSAMTGDEAIFQTVGIAGAAAKEMAGIARDGEFSSIALAPDDQALVVSGMRIDAPSNLLRLPTHVPTEQWHKLTSLNDDLVNSLNFSKMESFTFPGANGTKVQGFLVRPPNFDPLKKYPLKFLIHGGPQGAWGDAWSYRWNPELFAANGYVVVMINPRGSTGYGQKFLEEVSGDWGGRPYEDLMKGLDYAEAHYPFIDKTRECALGASYGGFMADYILTHTDRFACIVTHDGMYNPQSAFGTTEELWFNEWEFRPLAGGSAGAKADPPASRKDDKSKHHADSSAGLRNDKGADAVVEQGKPAHPWDFYDKPAALDPFRKFSPMLAIRNAKTPTLVIHGQRDYRLDVSEGLQLFTALQLLHVPSKMLYFPDEGHWVLKPKNSELWYETVNDWCDQWTHTNKYEGQESRAKGQGSGAQ